MPFRGRTSDTRPYGWLVCGVSGVAIYISGTIRIADVYPVG